MTRTIRLRHWQRAALDRYNAHDGADFLAVATPGAGKTTFALAAARHELALRPGRLVVVVPTSHLKRQWARAAAALDLHLETAWSPPQPLPPDMHGLVTTYQQVATAARALAPICRDAVVVLDEVHHAGDERAWGEALVAAFASARRRLLLSGTPFRSDTRAIPFVRYVDDEARPHFEYGYGEALAEHRVVRPVYFPRTNGRMEWSAPDGSVHTATFDDPLATERANQRLRTALSLEGEWLPEVLSAAHARLLALRSRHQAAGGLVVAMDQDHARGIASLLRRRLRTEAVVATSDDPGASDAIARFAAATTPWLVAVRMVSEGVDLPRLRVGVFATTTTTELFFRQAVGRLVRFVPGLGPQPAYLYIPDDPRLRRAAAGIAERRRHVLARRQPHDALVEDDAALDQLAPDQRLGDGDDHQLSLFTVISAVATDALVPDDDAGHELPADGDDDPALVLELPAPPPVPGAHPTPASPAPGAGPPGAAPGAGPPGAAPETRSEQKARLRLENADLARAIARATGWSHAKVNAELNRLSGLTKVTEATLGQLEARLGHGRRWLARC